MTQFFLRAAGSALWRTSAATKALAIWVGNQAVKLRGTQFNWQNVQTGPLAGAQVYVEPGALGNAVVSGQFESFLFDVLASNIESLPGSAVWDVGAHWGYHTLTFAAMVGETGHVMAFEPNPANVTMIERQLKRNPVLSARVQIQNVALSNEVGCAAFRFGDHETAADLGHLAEVGRPSDRIPESIYTTFSERHVLTETVDSIVEKTGVVPDVLKIDVEGAETLVVQGAQRTLMNHKPLLLIEVHNIQAMHAIVQLLAKCAYVSTLIEDGERAASRAFILAAKLTE